MRGIEYLFTPLLRFTFLTTINLLGIASSNQPLPISFSLQAILYELAANDGDNYNHRDM
jgi:hypothetical protein